MAWASSPTTVRPRPSGFRPSRIAACKRVGVLVLIDQHMVELAAHLGRQLRHLHQLAPVEQQIVVIQHLLSLLGRDIGLEQRAQLLLPLGAPGILLEQHGLERLAGIDGARVDGQARALLGKAPVLVGQAALMPHQIEQILAVAPVVDGEGRDRDRWHGRAGAAGGHQWHGRCRTRRAAPVRASRPRRWR